MLYEVKLQEGHPVDENLRPIKVGGELTALEVSKKDVRVNNLYVNGTTTGVSASDSTKLPLAGGTMTGDITTDSNIVSTDLTIDDSGDITLDAASNKVTFKNVGNTSIEFKVTGAPSIKMYETAGSADDYFLIQAASGGSVSLSTVDDAGADAHFTINVDGNIALDSHTGNFIAKKAGTEFSVANSAFAGMILGYTTVGIDATADSYDLTATMTVPDDALKVKFVAPPSGVVEIFASVYFDTSRRLPVLGLSDANATTGYSPINFPNSNDVTNEHRVAMPPLTLADQMLNKYWVVTGLTAGTAYEWWLGAGTTAATGGTLRWGGTTTGEYPPFIMKATALPTAVSDFAVYG